MTSPLLFRDVLLIDGTGRQPVAEVDVLVIEGRIAQIGRDLPRPIGVQTVEGPGLTLLPALIDCHVHLTLSADPRETLAEALPEAVVAWRTANHARSTLYAGITTVRDLGGRGHVNIQIARAIEEGLVEGPRVFAAGRWICMTGGHGWEIGREADGADEVRKAVREQVKAGAHVIKFMATGGVLTRTDPRSAQLSMEEMRAGVEEAHKAGRRVAAHAHSAQGVKNALLAGVDTIEHGTLMDDAALALLIERKAFYVPTLAPLANILAVGPESGVPEWVREKGQAVVESHKRNFQAALRGGVQIATGTDAGDPLTYHGANAQELRLMVEWGMTPMQAIIAATCTGADLLGLLDELGTVEVGKRADLLLVHGNPLDDIAVLERRQDILLVLKDGNVVRGSERIGMAQVATPV